MQNLNYYKEKIKEKRKQTKFRDFLKEIPSWLPLTFHRNDWLISRYPVTERSKVMDYEKFEKYRDDLIKYGLNYNFWKNFFWNFWNLFNKTDLPNLIFYWKNENSNFSDSTFNCKNVYLSNTTIVNCENIFYSFSTNMSSNVYSSLYVKNHCDIIYFSRWIKSSFKIFYSAYINNSNNIWFSSNLTGCSDCINSNNLVNKKYCIDNKVLEKEEYFKKKKEILEKKENFEEYFWNIEKIWKNHWSKNVSWNYILDSENVEKSWYIVFWKDQRHAFFCWSNIINEKFYDVFSWWWAWWEDFYWVVSAWISNNLYCSTLIAGSSNIFYSYFLENCSFCIWCIWLKNKSYCILNKQYSKEDWEKLSSEIFEQMEKDWILWKFFPAKLNPFYFNDTVAWLIGWFKKDEVVKEWFMWRDEKIKVDIPDESLVISVSDLYNFEWFDSEWNWKINPEVLKKVIKSENGDYYRIVKMEYDFLVKHQLPLPRLHWLERMKVNFGV